MRSLWYDVAVGISTRPLRVEIVSAKPKEIRYVSWYMRPTMTGMGMKMSHTHLRSFMIRSMSSPTRSTNNRSLLLSASMIDGSASTGPSALLSVSAGVGLGAGKGEGT